MWTLLEIYEVQFIVQLRSRLWSRNISGPIISSVELLELSAYIVCLNSARLLPYRARNLFRGTRASTTASIYTFHIRPDSFLGPLKSER